MCLDKAKRLKNYINKYHLNNIFSPELIKELDIVEMRENSYITCQSSRLTHLYVLVDGKLKVEFYNVNGKLFVFTFATPLFLIGDLELFHSRENSFISTISTQEQSVLLSIPLAAVKMFGLTDPRFLEFICKQLSNKLFESSLFQIGVFLNVEEKLKRFLYYNSKKHGSLFLLEKRENLASVLGVSVRQLNRAIKSLNEKGIIISKNKKVQIIDFCSLRNDIEF
ncbi:DNA-binding transcriptional activator YeiL [Photorhabdus australis subsp. thailandensis]|uniref:DNA-binding transcriptional activator YeiL n=1 Tax=Photorhabdus australis subsp. thailandensis TaxID=2805096 RepID=A0A1C0U4C3_9GAMM|nr:Crp/Fnr family transcriptional regulator [Photorhabdus australis]OCQ52774.1 DNA-binding transcriptional activator YeiL [Photorhabdus australis subsp. thailandensis]